MSLSNCSLFSFSLFSLSLFHKVASNISNIYIFTLTDAGEPLEDDLETRIDGKKLMVVVMVIGMVVMMVK